MSSTTPFSSKKIDSFGSFVLPPKAMVLLGNLCDFLCVVEEICGKNMGLDISWVLEVEEEGLGLNEVDRERGKRDRVPILLVLCRNCQV
jgi:hypothetical protein